MSQRRHDVGKSLPIKHHREKMQLQKKRHDIIHCLGTVHSGKKNRGGGGDFAEVRKRWTVQRSSENPVWQEGGDSDCMANEQTIATGSIPH